MHISSTYNPKDHEERIYEFWQNYTAGTPEKQSQEQGYSGQTHSILMPPPNLTGVLHAGHSFQHYLMDTLSRINRQKGKLNLWYPGVDHAGLQLEGVINKLISKGEFDKEIEEKCYNSLDFNKGANGEILEFFDKEGREILRPDVAIHIKKVHPDVWLQFAWQKVDLWRDGQKEQAKILGDTPDYSRELFTLDPQAVSMVNYAFEQYWRDGLIYKGAYLVNWSVGLQTALSDVAGEIEYETRIDPFVTFEYEAKRIQVSDPGLQEFANTYLKPVSEWPRLRLATVRIETKFTDLAVAMHPDKFGEYFNDSIFNTEKEGFDQNLAEALLTEIKRSAQEPGKAQVYYHLPALDTAELQFILSDKVDPHFGTGILKITPGHDWFDYQLYHEFVEKKVLAPGKVQTSIGRNGRLTEVCGEYVGLTIDEARPLIMKKLIETGFIPLKTDSELTPEEEAYDDQETVSYEEFASWKTSKQYSYLEEHYPQYQIDWRYEHNVSVCERTGTVIEPLISEEFFLSYANQAVSTGKTLQEHGLEGVAQTQYFSEDFRGRAENFLENIKDWCISRDLIWGHKMPVWYNLDLNPSKRFFNSNEYNNQIEVDGQTYPVTDLFRISVDKPEDEGNWVQEEKILDTWFSSSLWPLSTLRFHDTQHVIAKSYDYNDEAGDPYIRDAAKVIIKAKDTGRYLALHEIRKDKLVDYSIIGGTNEAGEKVMETLIREVKEEAGLDLDWHNIGYLGLVKQGYYKPQNNRNVLVKAQLFCYEIESESDVSDGFVDIDNEGRSEWVDFNALEGKTFTALSKTLQKFERGEIKPTTPPEYFTFYTTQELTTGKDIFYVWVVRMTTLGMYFTGRIPFESVVITPTILDEKGKKMSKSKGNGLNPTKAIEDFSSDSLRMALLSGMYPNRNMRMGGQLGDRLMEKYRNYGNKVWNVARFLRLKVDEAGDLESVHEVTPATRWIQLKFQELSTELDANLKTYEMGKSIDALYKYLWDYFADWYLEYIKTDATQLGHAWSLFKQFIIKLYPYLPFETEVIWRDIFQEESLLMYYLDSSETFTPLQQDLALEEISEFEMVVELIQQVRSIRGLFGVDPGKTLSVAAPEGHIISTYAEYCRLTTKLALSDSQGRDWYELVLPSGSIHVNIREHIADTEAEVRRAEKSKESVQKQINALENQLKNEKFLMHAEEGVVAQKRQDLADRNLELTQLDKKIEFLKDL
jgi:valyl-tRNA synthetase/8-oxo-dGTP pyrophosphatase MutT (NUDIX family)